MATAQKKNNYNNFPSHQIEKVLLSEPAKKAYRRSFDVTAEALFRLSFNVTINADDTHAKELEELVASNIAASATAIADERKRIKKMMKDNGVSGTVNFPSAMNVKVNITSPSAGDLLGVLCELDALVVDITNLWLHGVLDNRQYTQGLYINQRLVIKMMGRLRQLWFDARKRMHASDEDLKGSEATASIEKSVDVKAEDEIVAEGKPEPEPPKLKVAAIAKA